MNSQEQGKGNEQIRKKVDQLIERQLDALISDPEAKLSAAMVQALTARFGKPILSHEEVNHLQEQLDGVGGLRLTGGGGE